MTVIPRHDRGRRAGFTLLELLLALTITGIILGAMGSVILLTSRTAGAAAGNTDAREAARTLVDVVAELRLALTFEERSTTAVEFTVPDRDGDGRPETIRFAWSGTPGDPLTRQYNGTLPVVMVEDVHAFDLEYLTETATGSGGTDRGSSDGRLSVLFVVSDADGPAAEESLRRFLIEAMGHSVTLVSDEAPAAEFDAVVPLHDVVYVGGQVDRAQLGGKLTWSSVGVVCEEQAVVVDLGMSAQPRGEAEATSIVIDDNDHYITEPLFPGPLPILTASDALYHFQMGTATGATVLASRPDSPGQGALVVIERGQMLAIGQSAPARRVALPWGNDTSVERLNDQAEQLLERSLQWAARAEVIGGSVSPLFAQYEDPAVENRMHIVRSDDWAVASIAPDLPDDAVSYTITRVRFIAERKAVPDQTLLVQLLGRLPDGTPTPYVIGQKIIEESELPPSAGWFSVDFAELDSIPAGEGVALSISVVGSGDVRVMYESGAGDITPSNQFWWRDPSGWRTDALNDMPCEVLGTIEREDG